MWRRGLARGAHNSEVRCSNHLAGISHSQFTELALKPPPRKGGVTNRDGAEEARGAHNPEALGSNPSSGIFHFGSFTEAARGTYVPRRGV